MSPSPSSSSAPSATPSASPDWSLYPYDPSVALPIVFVVLVGILTALHIYQSFWRYSWPRFGLTMMSGSAVWIAGFICREISARHVQSVGVFIAQYVLILLGPPLYAAAESFILGRLFAYLPYHAVMHPGRVLSTFIILSAAIEGLTSAGAADSAGARHDAALRATGLACIKAGLLLQLALEIFFCSLVAIFHWRATRGGHATRNVTTMCVVLYVTSVMMMVRCAVRAAEGFEASSCDPSAPGYDGYCGAVERNEWFLWVFEVANITVFVAALALFAPGKYLPTDARQYLDPTNTAVERVGPGFSNAADKRPVLVTVLDPFNLQGIILGKGMEIDNFWDGAKHPVATTNYSLRGKKTQLKASDMA